VIKKLANPESERMQVLAHSVQRPQLALLLRLLAMVALAVMFVLVKFTSRDDVHVLEAVFWRQFAGLFLVLIWLKSTGTLGTVTARQPGKHFFRMILGLSAMAANFSAMSILPLAEATTIGFAVPLFATVLAATILQEPTGRYRWSAVAVGFCGVLIALQPDSSKLIGTGATMAIIGAILTSAVAIQLRLMARTESTGAIVFWFSLTSMVPLSIAMLFVGHNHNTNTWIALAAMAGAGAIAQILLTSSLRLGAVSAVLTMDYSSLLWSVIAGYFVFSEIPGPHIWFGAPLIILSGIIIAWREHRLSRAPSAALESVAG
jgi:drug/metabolite transporter (DMT)-like permease